MADQFPFRNVHTGVSQLLTEEQAGVFPGQFEQLSEDYEALQAQADEAAAAAAAVAASDASKSEQKAAQAAADDAQKAAAAAVVTPADAPTPQEG